MESLNDEEFQQAVLEQNEILRSVDTRLAAGVDLLRQQNQKLEQIRYSVAADMQREYFSKVLARQLSFLETLDEVSSQRLSMARYGDGELGLAADPTRNIVFQRGSFVLARSLRDVISIPQDGLLVCLPGVTVGVSWMTWNARYWGIISELIPQDRRWGIASVSRSDGFEAEGAPLVDAWRSCWSGRDVLVVTGKGSRFELVPELFSSARSVGFVLGAPKDAFQAINELEKQVLKRRPDLVLLALGPAGTVLSSRLHEAGVQALDIGHLSNSYNEHFKHGPRPERLPIDQRD